MSFAFQWWFSIYLMGTILMCAYLAHAEEGSGHSGFEDDEDIARKSSPNKTPKNLCNNFVGCTCNGKHDRAECSCLAMQLHEMRLTNIHIPSSMTNIYIKQCPLVVLDTEELKGLDIKLLNISHIDHLMVGNGSLGQVDKLIIAHVNQLDKEGPSFDQLEADTVIFKNVIFPTENEFRPKLIKSELRITHCNLTNFAVTVDLHQTTDRSIIMDHNHLDRVKLKINTADFQMKGNRFVHLSSESSGLMDIEYSRILNLEHNLFGKTHHNNIMPHLSSSNQSLVFNISMPLGLTSDGKIWLEHFKFIFTGQETKGIGKSLNFCNEKNPVDSASYRILVCSNVKELEQYLKTPPTNKLITGHQPEKQPQKQKRDDTGNSPSDASVVYKIQTTMLLVTGVVILLPAIF